LVRRLLRLLLWWGRRLPLQPLGLRLLLLLQLWLWRLLLRCLLRVRRSLLFLQRLLLHWLLPLWPLLQRRRQRWLLLGQLRG
jgi:hypothetical protein